MIVKQLEEKRFGKKRQELGRDGKIAASLRNIIILQRERER